MMVSKDITKEEVENFRRLLDYLKQLSEDGVTTLIEKQLLQMLDNLVPFFSHLIMFDVFPELHRITINKRVLGSNKRIREIKHLKYPPADKVSKYGRCNYPKQTVLYASFLHMTAMNETQPQVGDLVTQSVWRVKGKQTLKYVPIFKNQPQGENVINPRTFEINQIYNRKVREYPVFIREQLDALVQFIADAFTKRVHPNADLDYIFSAYFSNKIFSDFENGTIEAIYYPSVKDGLSFENVAIKANVFDDKYELVEVKDSVCVVDNKNGNGGCFYQGLSDSKSFDYSSGKILWDSKKLYQPDEIMNDLKKKYNLDISE
ncbi:MAG: hypothetical protein V4667_00480 [Bacteroidota bacterium]